MNKHHLLCLISYLAITINCAAQQASESLNQISDRKLSDEAVSNFIHEFKANYSAIEIEALCTIELRPRVGKATKLRGRLFRSPNSATHQLDLTLADDSGLKMSWKGTLTPPSITYDNGKKAEILSSQDFKKPLFDGFSISLEDISLSSSDLLTSTYRYLGPEKKKGRICQKFSVSQKSDNQTIEMYIDDIAKFPIFAEFLANGVLVKQFEIKSTDRKTGQLRSFSVKDKRNKSYAIISLHALNNDF